MRVGTPRTVLQRVTVRCNGCTLRRCNTRFSYRWSVGPLSVYCSAADGKATAARRTDSAADAVQRAGVQRARLPTGRQAVPTGLRFGAFGESPRIMSRLQCIRFTIGSTGTARAILSALRPCSAELRLLAYREYLLASFSATACTALRNGRTGPPNPTAGSTHARTHARTPLCWTAGRAWHKSEWCIS